MKAVFWAALCLYVSLLSPAWAEVNEIRIAYQYGYGHLLPAVMKEQGLIEKYAEASGIILTPKYFHAQGSAAMQDALLSGSADVVSTGVTALLNLWDKTKGDVKAVGPVSSIPMLLVTRNPAIKTVRDFSPTDRIAVPAVKVSPQAIFLEMAVAQAYGIEHYDQLDSLTVALAHPDAYVAFTTGKEITAHFAPPPFYLDELKQPGAHAVLNTFDSPNGATTQVMLLSTERFRRTNPKVFAVLVAAHREAMDIIINDKNRAAESYLQDTGERTQKQEVVNQLNEVGNAWDLVPHNMLNFADFMFRTGAIKSRPAVWKDLFFPESHSLPGS